MDYQQLAELSLQDVCLTRDQCRQVLECPDENILSLIDAAYRVRRYYFKDLVNVQVLSNAKSGLCPEDCHYCSQSRISDASIEKYSLVSKEQLIEEARSAQKVATKRFCMALSGRRPSDEELEYLCDVVRTIKSETGLSLCGSLGFLDMEQAQRLKEAGLDRVNHNLNTSERFYSEICTTHSYQERVETIRNCQAAGLEICSGGIIGQGETDDDIIDMLLALRELDPQAIPINFLVPIDGTPFEKHETGLNPRKCLKTLCLARFLNPDKEIRAAGGREYHIRSLQPLALYVADSIFVSGYLTTGGQASQDACDMIEDLGFTYVLEGSEE